MNMKLIGASKQKQKHSARNCYCYFLTTNPLYGQLTTTLEQ